MSSVLRASTSSAGPGSGSTHTHSGPRALQLLWTSDYSDAEATASLLFSAETALAPPRPAPPPLQPPSVEAVLNVVHADCDSFEHEIDEFFALSDLRGVTGFRASRCHRLELDPDEITVLLEYLLLRSEAQRIEAARRLLAYAQGLDGEPSNSRTLLSERIRQRNALLFSLDAFTYYRLALKHISSHLENLMPPASDLQTSPDAEVESAHQETTLYLCLLFLLVTSNENDAFLVNALCECDLDVQFESAPPSPPTAPATATGSGFLKAKRGQLPFAIDLFELVSVLAEGNRKFYPVKKLLLLLHKVLHTTVGNTLTLTNLRAASRAREGLLPLPATTALKASPQDQHTFQLLITRKYPAYYVPGIESLHRGALLPEPLSSVARRSLLNPPGPPGSSAGQPLTSVLQPLTGAGPPRAVEEASALLRARMVVGLREVQMSREMAELERVKRRAAVVSDGAGLDFRGSFEVLNGRGRKGGEEEKDMDLERVESLYRYLSPNITIHIGMLIRLLYYVNLGNELASKIDTNLDKAPSGDEIQTDLESNKEADNEEAKKQQDALEEADVTRHREVVTKAIAGILLALLKSFKCDDILKFEYVCQLLVDNNCAILILKMLSVWFQNPLTATAGTGGPGGSVGNGMVPPERMDSFAPGTSAFSGAGILKDKDEPKELNFFDVALAGNTDTPEPSPAAMQDAQQNQNQQAIAGSWRNYYTTVTLLRILQKLTKRKTHRIMALVQWKASAVLKRIVKAPLANPPLLHVYALKLLKSQVPLLAKKWRNTNMKVITNIYMHLKPNLCEEWLSGDADGDADEALAQEQYLRSLIACYHHRVYPDIYPPPAPPTNADAKDSQVLLPVTPVGDDLETLLAEESASLKNLRFTGPAGFSGAQWGGRNAYASEAWDAPLGAHFERGYQTWLEEEVFSQEYAGEEEEEKEVMREGRGGVGFGVKVPLIVDEFDWPEGNGLVAPQPTPFSSPSRNKWV